VGHDKKKFTKMPTLLEQEDKAEALETNAHIFSDRTTALKERYKAEDKRGFFSMSINSSAASHHKKIKPNKHESLKPVYAPTITTQQRLDFLEVNLKKYKRTKPRIFSASLRVMAEAADLLETELSIGEKIRLDQSLDVAINLLREPNQSTLDAAREDVKTAIGHADKFNKYSSALLSFVGAVSACIVLFVAPPFALVGFGLFLGGAYLCKHNQAKSMAKVLDNLADVTAPYLGN
jgi:hypothetical protein